MNYSSGPAAARLICALLFGLGISSIVWADDAPAATVATGFGLQVGNTVPTFYVRAITGPLKDKSVCYVCRNGERPVVMVVVREITPELPALLQQIDTLVDRHRADGLRSFAVFVSDNSRELLPRVQTLGFDHKINLPLTIAAAQTESPIAAQTASAVTVVMYRNQTVQHHALFRPGELTPEQITSLTGRMRQLALGAEVPP
jgi:hypothetical protein